MLTRKLTRTRGKGGGICARCHSCCELILEAALPADPEKRSSHKGPAWEGRRELSSADR